MKRTFLSLFFCLSLILVSGSIVNVNPSGNTEILPLNLPYEP